ncbi:hypothetical protein NDGK_01941 [Clostridiales bacterium CHKCI001]|nr:hypothetical protein NDGK_01941 [Clostridiales bacterium CHKCI001]
MKKYYKKIEIGLWFFLIILNLISYFKYDRILCLVIVLLCIINIVVRVFFWSKRN